MKKKINVIVVLAIVLVAFCSCKTSNVKDHTVQGTSNQKLQDSLAFELCQIYGSDQAIRSVKWEQLDAGMIKKMDTLNFKKGIKFVKENGYPSRELLGTGNSKRECVQTAVSAVLLHNPQRLVNENEYFNLFLNEVKKGHLKPDYLATILDKYYWSNSKKHRVFYGSQFGKPCMQTKEETNKARIEIGLKALEDKDFVDCGSEELNMPKKRV